MSEDSDQQRRRTRNPFRPVAVARVSESASDMVSIPTPSIRDATSYLDAYLLDSSDSSPDGNVIALTGDYGMGKTHLAVMLLDHARGEGEVIEGHDGFDDVRAVYLDATTATTTDLTKSAFLMLYLRFVESLPRAEVRSRVREYYADIAAGRLSDVDPVCDVEFADSARNLLVEQSTDTRDATSMLGLSESSLLQELRQKLKNVTENSDFSIVLPLLIRPGFEDAAWKWLNGGKPHPLLVERGVESMIDNATTALEALGVFALLYGHQNRRFIVIIDELDKLLPTSDSSSDAEANAVIISAVSKLLVVFLKARVLLVLAGLEEPFKLIGESTRQRISFIRMSDFDEEITCRFIEKCQEKEFGEARLSPFTPDSVKRIVELTYGNPRKITTYCHRLYRMAMLEDGGQAEITTQMVNEVAGVGMRGHIDAVIRRMLETELWEPRRDYFVGTSPQSRVDFWVPVGVGSIGCALLLTDAVVNDDNVDDLIKRVEAVRAGAPDCETLLIVNEGLTPQYAPVLAAVFGRDPLVYHPRTFADNFLATVKAMIRRLEMVTGEDTLVSVQERIERMSQQQSRTRDLLEQLATSLRELRSSSDQGFGGVRRELDDLVRAVEVVGEFQRSLPAGQESALPVHVNHLFENRLSALEKLGAATEVVGEAFRLAPDRRSSAEEAAGAVRSLVRAPNSAQALGAVALLRTIAEAFRRGIGEWFRSCAPSDRRRLRPSEQQKLDALCDMYDAAYEDLPLFALNGLAGLTGQRTASWSERLNEIRRQFEYLGVDVRQAVLNSFPR